MSVTLDRILGAFPTRAERFALSLAIASSFMQLLESPWLPTFSGKTNVVFLEDTNNPSDHVFGWPHVSREFDRFSCSTPETTIGMPTPCGKRSSNHFTKSLDRLGILLLELCFGSSLEDQEHRKRWPEGNNAEEGFVFDTMAARDWQCEVSREVGFAYAEAVGWCLGGNRSATTPERWRRDMLRGVIEPLQRCCDYLAA